MEHPTISEPVPFRRALIWSTGAVAALVFVAGLTELRDPDTFHLLAMGREILRQGGFPRTEPFLFPFQGAAALVPPSWLSSVIVFVSHRLLGDPGPVLLAASLAAIALAIAYVDAQDGAPSPRSLLAALLPLALALETYRERIVARPEMFAAALLALTLLAVRRHERGRSGLLLCFPVLAFAWSQLHQSVLSGVGVVALAAVIETTRELLAHRLPSRFAARGWRPAATAWAAAGAGLVASLASPGAWARMATSIGLATSQAGAGRAASGGEGGLLLMKHMITELGPLRTDDWLGPFGALVALTAVSSILAWRRGGVREVATAAAFVALAIPTRRFASLAALVCAPIAGRNLAALAGRLPARVAALAAAVAAVMGVAHLGWRVRGDPDVRFGVGLRANLFPVRAAQYLAASGCAGRAYNTFHFGGFLEWTLDRPVFQDGRGYLHPEDASAAFIDTSHWNRFQGLDDRYRFDALVIAHPNMDGSVAAALAGSGSERDWAAPREG